MPRAVQIGPVELNLFHRDGLVGDSWIGFHPREFEVLWRLAETPDNIVTRIQLLKDVWRLDHDPESNRVEVNISRIRSKLHVFKLSWLVVTGPVGGYHLSSEAAISRKPVPESPAKSGPDDMHALDSYLRFGNEDQTPAISGDDNAISRK